MITADSVPFSGAVTRGRWDNLVRQSTISSACSESGYILGLASTLQVPAEVTFIVQDERDVAGIVVLLSTSGRLKRVLPSPMTAFSALAALEPPPPAETHAHSSWVDVLAQTLGERYATVDLMLPPQLLDIRAFQWNGWTASPLFTYYLPVSDGDADISRWSSGTSRTYRKHRDDYVLRSDASDVSDVVQLCHAGYSRHERTAPLTLEQMGTLASILASKGLVQSWTVSRTDTESVSAGILLLRHESMAVYWMAGSEPGPAMTVLIGSLVSVLGKSGVEVLDFVGANTPAIAEFKRRFNPVLMPYFRLRYTRNRLLRFLQTMFQAVKS